MTQQKPAELQQHAHISETDIRVADTDVIQFEEVSRKELLTFPLSAPMILPKDPFEGRQKISDAASTARVVRSPKRMHSYDSEGGSSAYTSSDQED